MRTRLALVVVVLALASASCGDASDGDPQGRAGSTTAAPASSMPAANRDLPGSIERLADRLRCDTIVPSIVDPPEGPSPTEAYDCEIGDNNLSFFIYADEMEAGEAFAGLVGRCAPAVSDADWIVWTNTNEAATDAQHELGGDLSLVRDPC